MRINVVISGLVVLIYAMGIYANETTTLYSQRAQPREAFVLFYMSSCSHCRRFDPVLKHYATAHRIPVLAYTLDGRSLPGFPNSMRPNQQEISQFFPEGNPVVPALFLMDMAHHKIIPVLKGEARADQLSIRMQHIHSMLQY